MSANDWRVDSPLGAGLFCVPLLLLKAYPWV